MEADEKFIPRLPWKIGSGMIKGNRSGVFFCAVVGSETNLERTYLRFVPADSEWQPANGDGVIERELGTCLRLIECEEHTQLWYPSELRNGVYDFWEVARDDIWFAWMRETDPVNLQPQVRPLNHRVAEFIRANHLIDTPSDRVHRALDILESPWPRREEMMLRGWFESNERKGTELAGFLIDQIINTGFEPTATPQPLPPIDREDVELFCWIGIKAED